ncbi:MAG: 2Fe-2S iron-sulfur cluster binding domain-containing protein [Chitinophagaceae bacterium]|nr:2Fe-2S iron-sulfur cluster binding domain-containing protein [Chitinophagaceae bacterium]
MAPASPGPDNFHQPAHYCPQTGPVLIPFLTNAEEKVITTFERIKSTTVARHFHRIKVKKITKETPECVSIEFDIPEEKLELFAYKQGQNITIKSDIDDKRRAYSICSSPLENKLTVAVKRIPDGVFSTFALEKLKEGDELEIMEPAGSFYTELNPAQSKYYVFFAAGSGITPIISIIKTVLATEPESRVALFYGNKSVATIIFKDELEGLKDKYMNRFALTHVLSKEQTDSPLNTGRIDPEKLKLAEPLFSISKADDFFVCGPEAMIFAVRDYLVDAGVESSKIHFELFNTPVAEEKKKEEKQPEAVSGEESDVAITVDGRTYEIKVPYETPTILDAGLDMGIDLPYSCKSGVCTTCRAKLLKGEVEMDCNYGLEDYEVEAGYILTCQSHPRTPECEVDYDQ